MQEREVFVVKLIDAGGHLDSGGTAGSSNKLTCLWVASHQMLGSTDRQTDRGNLISKLWNVKLSLCRHRIDFTPSFDADRSRFSDEGCCSGAQLCLHREDDTQECPYWVYSTVEILR